MFKQYLSPEKEARLEERYQLNDQKTQDIKRRFEGFFATNSAPGPKTIDVVHQNDRYIRQWLPKRGSEITCVLDSSRNTFKQEIKNTAGWDPKMIDAVRALNLVPAEDPNLKRLVNDNHSIANIPFGARAADWRIISWVVFIADKDGEEGSVLDSRYKFITDKLVWENMSGDIKISLHGWPHYP
jgi:hypothetical protein